MTEKEAFLVLNAVPNLDAVRIRRLVAFFGSAVKVNQASLEDLIDCRLLSAETVENIFNFSKDKFLQDEYNLMKQKGISAIVQADAEYPCSLNDFDDAPVVLYLKGDADCLGQACIAIVGSRAASFYGRGSANSFARAFAEAGMVVVSGLARGIDTAAHQGCLDAGGRTVAVMGCGFNYVYPQENRVLMGSIAQQGAVVTEYACTMPPLKFNFPWRNRIISALSLATVVVEAASKSGALITADFAVAQNKDVFVLPSNIDHETALGSNQLIQDGAEVALRPEDVLFRIKPGYAPSYAENSKPVLLLSEEQSKVYPHITSQPVHLDDLARHSGLDISRLMNITLSLELKQRDPPIAGSILCKE